MTTATQSRIKSFHIFVPFGYIDAIPNSKLVECFNANDSRRLTPQVIRDHVTAMRAKGYEGQVIGDCDNVSPSGRCMGHEQRVSQLGEDPNQ